MGETEREPPAKPEETRSEVESPEARRVYAAPEVTVLEFRTVIKGISGNAREPLGGFQKI